MMVDKRVFYATAVFGDEEIGAILEVLDGGRGTLRLGKNVAEMERRGRGTVRQGAAVSCATRARRRSISRSSCSGWHRARR